MKYSEIQKPEEQARALATAHQVLCEKIRVVRNYDIGGAEVSLSRFDGKLRLGFCGGSFGAEVMVPGGTERLLNLLLGLRDWVNDDGPLPEEGSLGTMHPLLQEPIQGSVDQPHPQARCAPEVDEP